MAGPSMSNEQSSRIVIFARPEDPAELRDLLQTELNLNKVDAGIAVAVGVPVIRCARIVLICTVGFVRNDEIRNVVF